MTATRCLWTATATAGTNLVLLAMTRLPTIGVNPSTTFLSPFGTILISTALIMAVAGLAMKATGR